MIVILLLLARTECSCVGDEALIFAPLSCLYRSSSSSKCDELRQTHRRLLSTPAMHSADSKRIMSYICLHVSILLLVVLMYCMGYEAFTSTPYLLVRKGTGNNGRSRAFHSRLPISDKQVL